MNNPTPCPICGGNGYVPRPVAIKDSVTTLNHVCPRCKGTGIAPDKPCKPGDKIKLTRSDDGPQYDYVKGIDKDGLPIIGTGKAPDQLREQGWHW